MTAVNISSPVIAKTFKKVKNRVQNIQGVDDNINPELTDFDISEFDILDDTQEFNIT